MRLRLELALVKDRTQVSSLLRGSRGERWGFDRRQLLQPQRADDVGVNREQS
jgi:hypothetical protein